MLTTNIYILLLVQDSKLHTAQDAKDYSSPRGMSTVCHAAQFISRHHMEIFLQIFKFLGAVLIHQIYQFVTRCLTGTDWLESLQLS